LFADRHTLLRSYSSRHKLQQPFHTFFLIEGDIPSLVARINAERNPVREPSSFFPKKKVKSTERVLKRPAGNLAEKEVKPCQREDEKAISQKKRGGLSA